MENAGMEIKWYSCYFYFDFYPFLICCERTRKDTEERIHEIRVLCEQIGNLRSYSWDKGLCYHHIEEGFVETRQKAMNNLDKLLSNKNYDRFYSTAYERILDRNFFANDTEILELTDKLIAMSPNSR